MALTAAPGTQVIQLFLAIIIKAFVDNSAKSLESRAAKHENVPTLAEVMVVPFKLMSYILQQAKMIFVQVTHRSFTHTKTRQLIAALHSLSRYSWHTK